METTDKYPLITVVIPTYNRAGLLKKAVLSVCSQTYRNIELIIADDGSSDDTEEMIIGIKDPRIKYLPLPHSGRINEVRNAGAGIGVGKWIAFLDSDDVWLPGKLTAQVHALVKSGSRWCYTNYELMNEQGKALPLLAGCFTPLSGWITKEVLNKEATVIICTLLLERELFNELGGFSTDRRLIFRGDYEFAIRLSQKAPGFALPEVFVKVLEHRNRVTSSIRFPYEISAVPYEIFLEQNKYSPFTKNVKKLKAHLIAEAAINRSAAGHYHIALRQLMSTMRTDSCRHWLSSVYRSVAVLWQTHNQKQSPLAAS